MMKTRFAAVKFTLFLSSQRARVNVLGRKNSTNPKAPGTFVMVSTSMPVYPAKYEESSDGEEVAFAIDTSKGYQVPAEMPRSQV